MVILPGSLHYLPAARLYKLLGGTPAPEGRTTFRRSAPWRGSPRHNQQGRSSTNMVILLALLLVALFFGLGFAVHLLWIVAVIALALWVVGFAVGRGASAGSQRFSRW